MVILPFLTASKVGLRSGGEPLHGSDATARNGRSFVNVGPVTNAGIRPKNDAERYPFDSSARDDNCKNPIIRGKTVSGPDELSHVKGFADLP